MKFAIQFAFDALDSDELIKPVVVMGLKSRLRADPDKL